MADQEQVTILKQGVGIWNTWRRQHPANSQLDLRDVNLREVNLREVNLSNADLTKANLSNADLSNADLRGATLTKANLRGATLTKADLGGADLTNAQLSNTDLFGTNLTNAQLTNANLYNAVLTNATLSNADLRGADLSDVNFNASDLTDTDLRGAELSSTHFSGANLTNTNFTDAKLAYTVFASVDLQTVKGLETVRHEGPSTIGTDTLEYSHGNVPEVFLRGVGLSDTFIEYAHALVQKPIDYYTCFISYSSMDEAFAKRLYSDLQSEGVRCWFAPEDMDIGDKIQHRINESIRKYEKLLLILSKHSIYSTWVAYEVERAVNKEQAGMQNVLYPVRLDKTILMCEMEWAQDIKQTRHIGNFEGWKTNHDAYQDSFKRLLRALQSKNAPSKDKK